MVLWPEETNMQASKQRMIDRRGFLKLTGAGLGGVLLRPSGKVVAASPDDDDLAILYDASQCIGCRACERACKEYNNLPDVEEPNSGLSATTWNVIERREGVELEGRPFFNYQCMHCTDAACVEVCPSGALAKDEQGFVSFDANACIGCGYCTQFCPFGVPHLQVADLITGEAKAAKCTFCQDKTRAGTGGPSCAEACPTGALTWGKRATLLNQAKARVSQLKAEGYRGAMLYGESEAGGLHRLSILLDEPAAYGLPTDVQGATTAAMIYKKILRPVTWGVFGAALVGVTAAFALARRTIHMEEVE